MGVRLFYVNILILILLATTVFGAEEDNVITYTLVKGSTIVEHKLSFSDVQPVVQVVVPLDSEAIEVIDGNFEIIEHEDYKIISIDKVKETTVKYITDSLIEKTKDRFFAINLANISGSKDITVILPESASLKHALGSAKSSLIPATDDLRTDGKHMLLHWDTDDLDDANSLLVIYNEAKKISGGYWLMLVLVSLLAAVLIILFITRGMRKEDISLDAKEPVESKDDVKEPDSGMTRNLFEEEKAIVETLLKAKDNELWQKELLFELGISKVKLSRKLRSLEYKGIIERVPFGNTNKIRLKQV